MGYNFDTTYSAVALQNVIFKAFYQNNFQIVLLALSSIIWPPRKQSIWNGAIEYVKHTLTRLVPR